MYVLVCVYCVFMSDLPELPYLHFSPSLLPPTLPHSSLSPSSVPPSLSSFLPPSLLTFQFITPSPSLPPSLPASPSPLPSLSPTDFPDKECPPALLADNLPDDLFSVLFKCQSHLSPWRSLLAHAIALQRPLLAILAACDKVNTWRVVYPCL